MAEAWPEGIPYADLDWSVERQENVVRFTPERGPGKVRRVATKAYEVLRINLTLTMAQYRTWRTWYETTLNDGIGEFYYPDFLDDGQTMFNARFRSAPSASRNGDMMKVSAEVELLW